MADKNEKTPKDGLPDDLVDKLREGDGDINFVEQGREETRADFVKRVKYLAQEGVITPYDQPIQDLSFITNLNRRDQVEKSGELLSLQTPTYMLLNRISTLSNPEDPGNDDTILQDTEDAVHDVQRSCKAMIENGLVDFIELRMMLEDVFEKRFPGKFSLPVAFLSQNASQSNERRETDMHEVLDIIMADLPI